MAGYTSWAEHGPNGVPSHFVGSDGGRQRLLLNTEGLDYPGGDSENSDSEAEEDAGESSIVWRPVGVERCEQGADCSCDPGDVSHFVAHSHPASIWIRTWQEAVRQDNWDHIKVGVEVHGAAPQWFGLRDNQKAEMKRWLTGSWDRRWLRMDASMRWPASFYAMDGACNHLKLE